MDDVTRTPAPTRKTKPKGRHPHKRLSAAFVRSAPPGRHCDGNGLYLYVQPSGARSWVQRLVIRGRRRDFGLGSVALVSLAEAREKARANRKLAREGGDPLAERRRARGIPSFAEATGRVLKQKQAGWRSKQHGKDWLSTLKRYAFPRIGQIALSEVATADVTPPTAELTAFGATAQLGAEVFDQFGDVMPGVAVSWSSDATPSATVDASGLVTAAGNGTATITATAGAASGSATVSVMQSAASVTVSPAVDTVEVRDTVRLTAEAFDENGHGVADAEFAWSSSHAALATVDGSGLVRGLHEGATTITATAGVAGGSAEVIVLDPERDALVALYLATDGPNWVNSDNWVSDAPLGEWYGVDTRLGSVTWLDLWANKLSGHIPSELGNLANLEFLHLHDNQLSGPIPPELGNLAKLVFLTLHDNQLSGPIPPELGNLPNLGVLYLADNQLSGPIPSELGNLANLEFLPLHDNQLSGPIPPELGNLPNLDDLYLNDNQLSGHIPPELGNLANLNVLYLADNQLSRRIPPELGNLGNLDALYLHDNELSGSIPPELGNLGRLIVAAFDRNSLSGPLPRELGNLTSLFALYLDGNDFTGTIPAEFGRMEGLRELALSDNEGMAGPLPSELTSLDRLYLLLAGGTELCAPTDPDFQSWLEGVYKRRIVPCGNGGPSMAYLTQAVQSREFPVPLVAGEEALLRVFVIARDSTSEGIPPVRARFYLDGEETHVAAAVGRRGRGRRPLPRTGVRCGDATHAAAVRRRVPAHRTNRRRCRTVLPELLHARGGRWRRQCFLRLHAPGAPRMGAQSGRHHPLGSGRLGHPGRGQRQPGRHPARSRQRTGASDTTRFAGVGRGRGGCVRRTGGRTGSGGPLQPRDPGLRGVVALREPPASRPPANSLSSAGSRRSLGFRDRFSDRFGPESVTQLRPVSRPLPGTAVLLRV